MKIFTKAPNYVNEQTRKEALSLYRDAIRTFNAFYWADNNGEPWSTVLKRSARKEFEQNRELDDPVEIKRQIVTGNQSLVEIKRRFNAMEQAVKERIENTKVR